jgi:nucleoid-associated protein YgaU
MKQHERILVYAVTGFLALILVVAVLFGRERGAVGEREVDKAVGLDELIGSPAAPPAAGGAVAQRDETAGSPKSDAGARALGLPAPEQVAAEGPLAAGAKPMIEADIVAEQIGPSRRDRNVRFVRARQGDSLEVLVRRWCGVRDPFLEDARSLNEDLGPTLRIGQEIAVPWVEDAVVLAALEARQPKRLVADAAHGAATGQPVPASSPAPDFAVPGGTTGAAPASTASPEAASAATTYTVQNGDSLWKIAERAVGRKNADKRIAEIRRLNPELHGDAPLRVGQKIKLPK